MPTTDYRLHVFLEDSHKVQELQEKLELMEETLKSVKAEKRKAESLYFRELEINMRLNDELKELRDALRNN